MQHSILLETCAAMAKREQSFVLHSRLWILRPALGFSMKGLGLKKLGLQPKPTFGFCNLGLNQTVRSRNAVRMPSQDYTNNVSLSLIMPSIELT